ncbi:electron transport complex subunit RsxC [Alishewanella jeotgali]|uniref:Ion-translocating oxidoreductase complex subunit C n=1 Tax=Alishewanella jeotgali KCTC 22429 TaxID=1129374 RepID=H3ZIW1_9ALTE|nr:electron transport complex subunit RsxC [Alishewanella jeotgali]EHR39430.1 electron transport complex protein RnfC [Alishewanella jeotgali KCTC 22429]
MPTLFQQIQAGTLWDFHGGIHPPVRKSQTSSKPVAQLPLPDRLYLPLRQHIGVAGRLIVAVGQRVLKGEALTSADNSMAVPVHAPTSGVIHSISQHTSAHPSALPEPVIVLVPDGKDEWRERRPLNIATSSRHQILERIQDSGIAGMGGAGFPTHLKAGMQQPVDYLIINAVECEPYISADDALMQEAPTTIVKGIDILCQLLNPKAVLIGIEADKPIAIAALKAACSQREHYYVREVPVKYPSGGEKQLIQLLTNKEVPAGRRPADIGIVMQNVGTAFAIAQAVLDDQPLISRIVTVTGETLRQPQNVLALLGTPVSSLLDFCGFQSEAQQKVIMGGPMMGFTLPDLAVPIVKTTNCILAPTRDELPDNGPELDCIRCGQCADACPATLLPQQLLWYSKARDPAKLQEYNLFDCIECGACAYVCPSEIPLVQYYRVAKAEIREQQREALKAEQAKARFEARNARLEQEKQQRLARNQQLAAARQQTQPNQNQTVAEALARVKAQQAEKAALQATDSAKDHQQILAERELKKQQAREYQAQKQATAAASAADSTLASTSDSSVDSKAAAVAAAIARAKARQADAASSPTVEQTTAAEPTTQDTADPRKAAVAAALARAKARQAGQTNSTMAEPSAIAAEPEQQDPRKAAIAAALARAKAKQSVTATVETTVTEPVAADAAAMPEDPRKAAIAAALARAKAKQSAAPAQETAIVEPAAADIAVTTAQQSLAPDTGIQPDTAGNDDPRKAAVAAALARAKARKAQQSTEHQTTEQQLSEQRDSEESKTE